MQTVNLRSARLYDRGMRIGALSFLFLIQLQAQPLPATLHGFGIQNASVINGERPDSTLLETSPGIFYGTTSYGGRYRCGTLFKITSAGVFTKLHDFQVTEGCVPTGRLVQAGDGLIYGTTTGNLLSPGLSTLFRSDLTGNVTTVQVFHSGSYPLEAQAPTLGADGSVYVVVTAFAESLGVEIYPVYSFVVHYTLYSIKTGSAFPVQYITPPLTLANDGNLYGVSSVRLGNMSEVRVFRVTPTAIQTVLTTPDTNLYDPVVAIGQGSDNKLYFATQLILASADLNGRNYSVVEAANNEYCEVLQTGFLLGGDGQLYAGCGGTVPTVNGSIYFVGTNGTYHPYTTVFGGAVQLASQSALATQGMDGNFYGEVASVADPTSTSYYGSIYSLDTGLAAPAPAVILLSPSSGAAGSPLTIYGDHLLGATSVSFDGLAAQFQVTGVNLITATVPAGATTGKVSVTTPNGSGTSASNFTVTE